MGEGKLVGWLLTAIGVTAGVAALGLFGAYELGRYHVGKDIGRQKTSEVRQERQIRSVHIGDINGDNIPDVVIRYENHTK